jgi:peptidoglycan/LPS O-acetylase OafA/YrhL
MASAGTADRSYRPDIDGIRAIAILSVVLYHAGVPWLTGGFTGVDIFFVISGFLIGGHIFSEVRSNSFSFLRFYQRRAKRILPAFYLVLGFTILASMLLLSPREAIIFGRSSFAATLSASNILFWYSFNYFDPQGSYNPLLMTWSLGVEEQFYAVIPLLMVLLARIRRNWLLPAILIVCLLSFSLAWYELGNYPMNVFYLLPERAWELGAGVALAVAQQARKSAPLKTSHMQLLSLTGIALIIAPIFLLNARSPFPGPAALPSVLGAALLIAAPASWINRRLLSLSPLVFIGRISYSWYLWHWPMLAYLQIASQNKVPRGAALLAVVASLAAAVLSYYFIEQPFRKSTRPPGPLLIRYAIVSAAILALCASVWVSKGFPGRFPELAQTDNMAKSMDSDPCLISSGKPNLSPRCYSAVGPSIALWGDSHTASLAPGLRALASAQGYGFIQLTHTSCPPLTGAAFSIVRSPQTAGDCIRYNSQALELLRNDPRVRIVVLNGWWKVECSDCWIFTGAAPDRQDFTQQAAIGIFRNSLAATIQGLQAAGKQVIVMGDVPVLGSDPLLRFLTGKIPARRALATWMGADLPLDGEFDRTVDPASVALVNSQLKIVTDGFAGVPLIDLKSEFCDIDTECRYRIGDHVLYRDHHHLSLDGAIFALRDFRIPRAASSAR